MTYTDSHVAWDFSETDSACVIGCNLVICYEYWAEAV